MILKELKTIQHNHGKKDVLKFLCEKGNRAEVLAEKVAMYGIGKPHYKRSSMFEANAFGGDSLKQSPVELGQDEFFVVGNSVGFIDSHEDVSMRGSWNKTAQEYGNKAPILKDHDYSVNSMFAENKGVIVTNMPIVDLGYDGKGLTEVIGATIYPFEDADKERYEKGIIKQHSVGLQYVKIGFAINDESEEDGYKEWLATRNSVINGEKADELGYYFPVYEQKLIEISAVVFGSNPYTPAFKNNSSLKAEPSTDTRKDEPSANEFLSKLIY